MKVLITHLTRLNPGHICAAGINLETGEYIRPVLQSNLLTPAFLAENGGSFQLTYEVDLGWVQNIGKRPELEDRLFEPKRVRGGRKLPAPEFWAALQAVARNNLREIFGPDLIQSGRSAIIEEGKGEASLGTLKLSGEFQLYLDRGGHLRLSLHDGYFRLNLPVTDLRFYEADYQTVRQPALAQAQQWCRAGVETLLSVGLSRAWQKPGGAGPCHWLQVNNLHFAPDAGRPVQSGLARVRISS